MRVRAPTIYQANEDELAAITVSVVSNKDPAINDERLTLTLMDVVHGINLDTSHYQVDVEQGQSAIFSITVTNTGMYTIRLHSTTQQLTKVKRNGAYLSVGAFPSQHRFH